ncbi:hypothetical protein HDU86_006153 [Geranomyces michiganensis]|nr:hypothetical protein HDU86_006153 [Geranomyces michiganensis]
MAELDGTKAQPSERTRMLQILRKFEAENDYTSAGARADDDADEDDGDDEVPDLAERVHAIDLETADADTILSRLTPAERAEFEASLREGSDAIRGYVDIWTPWWWAHDDDGGTARVSGKSLIREIDESPPAVPLEPKTTRPPILSNLKSLQSLTASKPADSLIFNLVDIIGAYAFMSRFLNGDWREDPVEGARIMWDVSRVVGSEQPFAFTSVHDALSSLKLRTMQNESYGTSTHTTALNLADISRILASPPSVLSALSDAHNVFNAAHTRQSSQHEDIAATASPPAPAPALPPPVIPRAMRRRAFASAKKLYFYVCLLSEPVSGGSGGDDALPATAALPIVKAAVDAELGVLEREIKEMESGMKAAAVARQKMPRGPLVQELF